jgi:hypothetical protein
VLERLIENWLDSAGERSYQRCFCQMLTGQGHRIIHNTEHTPLEFGKDVLALTPDGKLVGYQLKGNPGATMKPYDFDKIRGQLEQLATLALAIPGFEGRVPDECYLVTNGEIDEAVYLQLKLLNESLRTRGHPPEKLRTITRGTLLAWAKELGLSLWPTEMEDFGNLVKLLNYHGDEIFPAKAFDALLQHTLRFDASVKAPELRRRITSAAVMTAVALHSFSRQHNHFAEITAWTMFATYAIAACEKNAVDFADTGQDAVTTAREGIRDLLSQLCAEAAKRGTLVEGDPLSDFAFYRARVLLVYALMGIYWMWSQAEGWKRPEQKAAVEALVKATLPAKWLWGEGAVTHFLTYAWYRKRVAPSPENDQGVAALLALLMKNKLGQANHLPSPYYSAEDVARHAYARVLRCDDPFGNDGFERDSYVCEGLMACVVRANLKDICQQLWPDFTRINHERIAPDSAWSYGLYRMGDAATNVTHIYQPTMQWLDLQALCNEDAGADIPAALRADPFLLLLFVNIFPFRASFSAVKFLHRKFVSTPEA